VNERVLQTDHVTSHSGTSPGTLDRWGTARAHDNGFQCAEPARSPSQRCRCTASTDAEARQEHRQTYDISSQQWQSQSGTL